MTDRDTGRSRGFGFVEMTSNEDGEKAIAALNGSQVGGRTLNVNEARPKTERPGGGGGGGGGFATAADRGGRGGGGGAATAGKDVSMRRLAVDRGGRHLRPFLGLVGRLAHIAAHSAPCKLMKQCARSSAG